jgi:uncharacterized protein YjaZ
MMPKVAQLKMLTALVVILGITALGISCAGGDAPERSSAATVSPTAEAAPATPLQPVDNFAAAGGRFVVYRIYPQVRLFVDQARARPGQDRWELFRPLIVQSMLQFFSPLGQDWETSWAEWVRSADLDALEHTVAVMEQADVDGIVASALEDISAALSAYTWSPSSLFLVAGQWPQRPSNFYGYASGGGAAAIFLYAAPGEDPTQFWRQALPGLVAHEVHHSIRLGLGQGPANLAGQMVFEGLAEAFAEEVFGTASVATFDKETEQRLWVDVKKDAMTLGQGVIQRYIEGGEGIPPNTAHYFGYRIVTAYKANHPGVTVASLTGAPSVEIYEESGYEP